MVSEIGICGIFFVFLSGWEHAGAESCFSWREKKTMGRRGQTAVKTSNNKEQTAAAGEHQVQISSHPPVIFTDGGAKGGGSED